MTFFLVFYFYSPTFLRVVIADVFYCVSHHLLVVHVGPGCDLTTEQHHASLAHRLCQYTLHMQRF